MSKSKPKRTVLVVTGSRGEYGYIRPILKRMQASSLLHPEVLATNMHLLPEFGNSVNKFAEDGIPVAHRSFMTVAGYTNETMVKSLGLFMLSIADIMGNSRPDLILLAGDRGEQLVAAIAGAHLNIPVAHIQAGELSGNIDGMSRHAITKFAHIHFAANPDAYERLIRMGEQDFRVHLVGAPQLDDFVAYDVTTREALDARFHLTPGCPFVLIVQHPVTEQALAAREQMVTTLEAVRQSGYEAVIILPNSDAGSVGVRNAIETHRFPKLRIERNVDRRDYASLMHYATAMVGNSSSGLLEAPSFGLPAINIGIRQAGRFRGENVLDVDHDVAAILAALEQAQAPDFRARLRDMDNPYGDGHSSERIVKTLESVDIDERLLYKSLTY